MQNITTDEVYFENPDVIFDDNFSQIKQLNPELNGKDILKYSEQFLTFFTSKYLVSTYLL